MKLRNLIEDAHELGIRFRLSDDGGRVRLTFGNRGVDLYHTEPSKRGTIFQPITPWGSEPLVAKSQDPRAAWQELKDKIEKHIVAHFRAGSPDARIIGKKLNMWN